MPLCASCHAKADTLSGREELAKHIVDMAYLQQMEQWTYKEYLVRHNLTDTEFMDNELEELKQVAADPRTALLTWVSRH